MVQLRQQLALELMREADVNTVQEIEREIFATPWPRNAYYRELASRGSAHYVVLRQEGQVDRPVGYRIADFDPTIIGYGGMWRWATDGSCSPDWCSPPTTWAPSG